MRLLGALFFGSLFFFAWFVCICLVGLDRIFKFNFAFPRDGQQLLERQGWLLAQLIKAEAIPEGAVLTSVEASGFKEEEVFRSQTVLVELTYEHEGTNHSFRCLAKFAPNAGSLSNRALFLLQACHIHEVDFYNVLEPGKSLSVPLVYFGQYSAPTGHLCVLMEYYDKHIEYSEEEGCPPERVPLALEGLASLHAAFWGRKEKDPAWLVPFPKSFIEFFGAIVYYLAHEKGLRHYALQAWHQTNQPQTVIHGDSRVGNMLFPAEGEEGDVILFDWQGTRIGLGVFDVAYLLVLSLPADLRVAEEEEWVRQYHSMLCDKGVTGYSWETCLDDYRHCCLMVMILLGLPWLSGEVSADERQQARLLSGGVTWAQRLYQMVKHFDDTWLQKHYNFDLETFVRDAQFNLRNPSFLHSGSQQISRYIRDNGGFELLETEEGLQQILATIPRNNG